MIWPVPDTYHTFHGGYIYPRARGLFSTINNKRQETAAVLSSVPSTESTTTMPGAVVCLTRGNNPLDSGESRYLYLYAPCASCSIQNFAAACAMGYLVAGIVVMMPVDTDHVGTTLAVCFAGFVYG